MPVYKSENGKWIPVCEVAKAECKKLGIEYRGMEVKPKDEQGNKNHGVMAAPVNPKVAKDKFDGEKIAEPTAAQKKRSKKNA